jgi:hypothetical protein
VRVWASRTGRQTVCVTGGTDYTSKNTDEVLGVSFSADGSFVATAGADGSARLFDARSGSQLYLFNAHSDRVTCVRISPDGFVLASSSKDKTVKLWGITSRLQLHVLQGHTEEVRCVVWSPDSQMLASGADDQFVTIWNAHGGESVQVLKGHSGGVYALDWSHNGDLLASRWGTYCCLLWVACIDLVCASIVFEFILQFFRQVGVYLVAKRRQFRVSETTARSRRLCKRSFLDKRFRCSCLRVSRPERSVVECRLMGMHPHTEGTYGCCDQRCLGSESDVACFWFQR